MSLLRAGQGDPRCPALEGESWAVYVPRLAEFLADLIAGFPVDLPPPSRRAEVPAARLPYREPGEEDEPWVPTRTVTGSDLAAAVRSKSGPWEDR